MSQDIQERPEHPTEGGLSISWNAPLPPPGALQAYEDVLHGTADRILVAFEQQEEHRQYMEKTALNQTNRLRTMRMLLGSALILSVIAVVILAVFLNQPWVSASVFIGSLVSLVAIFFRGAGAATGIIPIVLR